MGRSRTSNTMARPAENLCKLILLVLAAVVLVDSQDQSGFISIDCGSSTSYSDSTTGIIYVPDDTYIDSGESKGVSAVYGTGVAMRFKTVRTFPEGAKNCYKLKSATDSTYLIRAQFMYGNYDSRSKFPSFDLYIGVNLWTAVTIIRADGIFTAEMMHTPSESSIDICLVNNGQGTPFISALELRRIPDVNLYASKTGSMNFYNRVNAGSSSTNPYRYPYDVYDRIWNTVDWSNEYNSISTTKAVVPNDFYLPSEVMSSAVTPMNSSQDQDLQFEINDFIPGVQYYFYLHFAEIQILPTTAYRGFNIYVNDSLFYGPVNPEYLSALTIYSFPSIPQSAQSVLNVTLRMKANSTLPPILNALEVYSVIDTSQLETDSNDAQAINSIKSAYNVSRIWQGDPCAPQLYSWDGLVCSFTADQPPRITSLELSSSGLYGRISTYISGLKVLQKLDLSNNYLTGTVPDFLTTMIFLNFLNLSGNNLTGTVPAELVRKSKVGTLTLITDRNPYLCLSDSCNGGTPTADTGNNKKKTSSTILIVAAIGAVVLILIIVAFIVVCCCCILKKKKSKGKRNLPVMIPPPVPAPINDSKINQETSKFTYAQVIQMTNNFTRVIGKGGFGSVYHGYLNDLQVAVKMLSPSSSQGYKEFKAEAQILMRVHHRNLTSLVGYCDEGDKMGLIYEFMAQGDLHSHISEKNPQYLTWGDRLRIMLDAAQGLEYLHHGCKPPLVHRDIKCTNILLNNKLEAKLADFGLSRACLADADLTDSSSQRQTMVAGTPGYLDPEYYHTQQLHEKSDVFSFGVVILEVITSKPVMVMVNGSNRIHISKWVSEVISTKGDVKAIIDPRLRGDYDTNSVWKALEVAMSCVSPSSDQRPNMSQVVTELSVCLSMERARSNEGFTDKTLDSIEMVSFGGSTDFAPSAR